MELDNFWKQYNKMERKSFFRIGTGIVTTIALGACAYAQKQGWIDFTPNSSNTNPQSSEIDPTAISTKTGYERQKETLDSFLASKPEYAGREMFPINISFPLKGEPSDTVVIRSNEEEKADIGSYEYKFNGVELQPYTDAVVYTMKTDQDGKSSWVRLAGVYYPTADGSINTAWYYSPDAFNKDLKQIDYNRKVFGFNSNDTNFVFWPLIEPPYSIDWAADLASKDVNDYAPWDGIESFTLSMGVIQEPVGKALFAPAKIDTESPLPAGTMIPVEAKDIAEATADFMKLDTDGNGTISIDDSDPLSYHSKDTIFKISGKEDTYLIAGWEYKMVDGKLEYIGPREVLAPRPDAAGNLVAPETVLPHFNKEDSELELLHIKQTANLDIFDDGTLPTSKEGLRPDLFSIKPSKVYSGYYTFLPIPPGTDKYRFMLNSENAYPIWIDESKPARYINDLGVSISIMVLDQSGDTIETRGVIPSDQYQFSYDALYKKSVDPYLLNKNDDQTNTFLFINNAELIKIASANNKTIKSFSGDLRTILSSTYFTILLIK